MSTKNIPTGASPVSSSQHYIEPPSTRRTIFTRKRQIDDCHHENQLNYFPSRNSRQKICLQKQTSFDALKTKFLQNELLGAIKYLSPHFTRNTSYTSPPQKKQAEPKQKFIRKQEAPRQTSRDRCSKKHLAQTPPINKLYSFSVENSLESMITKNSEMTEIETTSRNWFSLQTENQNLHQEKAKLEEEKALLSQELNFIHQFLKKQRIAIPNTIKKHQLGHCNVCRDLSLDFQLKLNTRQSQFELKERELLNRLKQQQFQTDMLREQLQLATSKFEGEKETTLELLQVIQILKQECMSFKSRHESTVVKQDILMRKKAQFEYAQDLASKADKQRLNLRKTLGQYKQKMGRLNELIAQNKKQKERLDQSLDYSLDLSTSFQFS